MSVIGHPVVVSSASPSGQSSRDRRLDGIRALIALVGIMWVVQVVNSLDHYDFSRDDGIVPRSLSGLKGVVFSPFLHASWPHLIDNTIPFVILGLIIALAGAWRLLAVTAIIALVAGLGTWLISPSNSDTVGASGVVFGYATYLVARGFFNRNALEVGVGLVVGLLFGASLLASIVPHAGISWQDHVFGAIGGLVAARVLTPQRETTPRLPAAT